MRLLSIVEATSVTGPVKPLLMFSRLARAGIAGHDGIVHTLLTTARLRRALEPVANEFLSAARAAGLDVDVIPERFLLDPGVIARMGHAIRARAPDIVETHDFKSHFLFWWLRRTSAVVGPRWIAFHHGYTRISARVRVYQELDRLSLRHADAVLTLCAPFVEQLHARGVADGRIAAISNAVEPRVPAGAAELARLRASLGLSDSDTVIISVGRLSREKAHVDLIRAFRLLLAGGSRRNCKLLLVGDGAERAALSSAVSDLGNRVIFAGHQPDAWPYFCMADLFVLPSHSEGSPLVLFEAMTAGLPIVATAVGGIPEVVKDGITAVLIPPHDIRRLASALSALLSDSARAAALGIAARDAVRRFSPEAYAGRLLDLYRSVLSRSAYQTSPRS